MAFTSSGKKVFSDINITPLTDIFLVLLIIMMIIAPAFNQANTSITMPEINNGEGIKDNTIVISVTKDGDLFVNATPVSGEELLYELQKLNPVAKVGDNDNPDEFAETLPSDTIKTTDKEIIVKADEDTKSSVILDIMEIAQQAQYKYLTIAGEPLSVKAQDELKNQRFYQKPQDNFMPTEIEQPAIRIPNDNVDWEE